jgi:hypothetical protein
MPEHLHHPLPVLELSGMIVSGCSAMRASSCTSAVLPEQVSPSRSTERRD